MPTGKVKWFSKTKGYGFADIAGQDIFIHHIYFIEEIELKKGSTISCDIVEGLKGFKGKNIKLIKWIFLYFFLKNKKRNKKYYIEVINKSNFKQWLF